MLQPDSQTAVAEPASPGAAQPVVVAAAEPPPAPATPAPVAMPEHQPPPGDGGGVGAAVGFVVWRMVIPLVILGAGAAALAGLYLSKEPPARKVATDTTPLVETRPVALPPTTLELDLNGTIAPKDEVSLVAEVKGKVVEKNPQVESGNYVAAGAVLFRIDPQEYELQLKQIENEMAQTEADIEQNRVEQANNEELLALQRENLKLSEADLKRIETLAGNRNASRQEVEDKQGMVLNLKSSLQQLVNTDNLFTSKIARLKAQKQLDQARYDIAQLNLERATVRAPIAGIVSADNVEQDTFVQPGTELAKIENVATMEVQCSLRFEELYWLWRSRDDVDRSAAAVIDGGDGDADASQRQLMEKLYHPPHTPALVRYELAGRTYEWDAVLSRYEGTGLDPMTRTVPCRVTVPKPTEPKVHTKGGIDTAGGELPSLIRGMFVTVVLKVPLSAEDFVQVPISALRPGDEVLTVADAAMHVEPVRVARRMADSVLLYRDEGLDVGDPIISSPVSVVGEGMEVRIAQ